MSETTADIPAETPAADTAPEPVEDTDWKAEAEKFKALARKHEDRAKQNAGAAKELETLRQQSMTEQEKAVAQAAAEARSAAMVEFAAQLVDARFEAAAAGKLDHEQLAELLSNLDRGKFLAEDGTVDAERITAFVDRLAPKPADTEPAETPFPDLGQGTRNSQMTLGSDPLLASLKKAVGVK